ncbi:hypothetical protein [Paraburkholderia sp. ZP32-5]|uniref:hypothetical protein n=1 Tax=Paraburkholderia sp. ZP32-5 TaxID=2883245 RepID=UPI001F2FB086|nr:hypothetical protein [Paraburkholderia sp. ZP32-5]
MSTDLALAGTLLAFLQATMAMPMTTGPVAVRFEWVVAIVIDSKTGEYRREGMARDAAHRRSLKPL